MGPLRSKRLDEYLDLPQLLFDQAGWLDCIAGLKQKSSVSFDSVWGSSCALLAAALHDQLQRPILFVHPDEKNADQFIDDFPVFSKATVRRWPTHETGRMAEISADPGYGERLRLLKDMVAGSVPQIISASVPSLMLSVSSPDVVTSQSFGLRVGQRIDLAIFRKWLVNNAYQPIAAVNLPGEFSMRGGIIDVFAPDWSLPARVELFDDEIESIRFFDPLTQRSVEKISELDISGLPPADQNHDHLTSFLPPDTVVVLVEPTQIESKVKLIQDRSSGECFRHDFAQLQHAWSQFSVAFAGRIIPDATDRHCRLPISLIEKFSGDIPEIRRETDRISVGKELFLLATTESEINRLTEILRPSKVFEEGRLHFSVGGLHAGFRIDHANILVLGSDQLFSRSDLRRQTRGNKGKAIDSFVDLRSGDLIVHLAHGIGRFRGLKILQKDGQKTEHLELEFHGGTRIYVPATKIGLVQKYVGGTKRRPQLAKIGGKTWVKQKAAAEEAVNDLASDMLDLQAKRATRVGIPVAPDTVWQYEFEHSFPFHETVDQLTAIEAIKRDMESDKPMERLLCGDVGFGKTEVAMRAAFKAVENGYQVAILVPTTVLAEQHFQSLRERMAEFPLDIGKLSRFCTREEEKDCVERLRTGQVDIVVGTHRLTSKDVKFKKLGLIVIDEEQRFGVDHKERLKNAHPHVDVLTMSATPIPRTLHMSLVGMRDISNLESPPEDRLAVQTRVIKFDESVIREAMIRELNRDGQIYFVHNRVNDLHVLKSRLQHIAPEARLDIGHGQMPEGELEVAMKKFISGETDILLATTIVESGLDIPNANTIFINEAERYGLADLHQLRGRVGRYKHQAYCYLLVQPHKHVNPNAAKRLQAIEQYSEMGSGFTIAMRDLEIRGVGNLLGTEQSGHIASVGYELYCQLLEHAVRKLKRLPTKMNLDIDIDLPIEAYIPDEFVDDRRQKVDIYRRIQRIENFDDTRAMREELEDRYGKLPPPVCRILKLAAIKLEANLWQITQIFIDEKYLGFRFGSNARMRQLATASQYNLRVIDDSTAYLTLKTAEISPNQLLGLVKSVLQVDAGIS